MKHLVLFVCLLIGNFVLNVPVTSKVIAEEGKAMEHEGVIAPTKELMREVENRLSNMLTGILENNLKYVANEAGAVVDQSYKINQIFFDFNMKENRWFERAGIDPGNANEISKLKEDFSFYQKEIVDKALKMRKKALAGEQGETFRAFTELVEKTCLACHSKHRNWLFDQPGFHDPGR
ncbi:MAG: hypothetical protein FJ264_12580 [Planctomycetes bacterium]|nr:hypothetical protein [Planctomycetota bacterium]